MADKVITIDGPAGSGKSSVAKALAERLGFDWLDTGATYRLAALALIISESKKIVPLKLDDGNFDNLPKINIDAINLKPSEVMKVISLFKFNFSKGKSFLNGHDVSDIIRSEEVSLLASRISQIREVRRFLVSFQRSWLKEVKNAVIEGRDAGSVVVPNAVLKVFLTAEEKVRVKRRVSQMKEEENLDEVKKNIKKRDEIDIRRKESPLVIPKDSLYIDSTNLSFDEVVERILREFGAKCETK